MNIISLFILWIKTFVVSFWNFLLWSLITSFWTLVIFNVKVSAILFYFWLDLFEILWYSFIWGLASIDSLLIIISLESLLRVTFWHMILDFILSSFIELLCCIWHLFWLFEIIFLNIIVIDLLSVSFLFLQILFFPLIFFVFPNI